MAQKNYYGREERFSYPIRAVKSLSTEALYRCSLWTEWYSINVALIRHTSELGKCAAEGIVAEGERENAKDVAQEMADELRQCGDDRKKLNECAVKLYTRTTFLYRVLNEALRSDDMSKVQTLGPLCFLINSYVSARTNLAEEKIIYRGMTLEDEMIDEYREAVGKEIDWPAFTSTTKDRVVAELFGSTLCIIRLCRGLFVHGRDISHLSSIPDEDEFLLSVGFVLQVEKVESDPSTGKHQIYLRTVSEVE